MKVILMLTVVGTICVTVGLLGLYVSTTKRLYALEKEIKAHKSELTTHKRQIGVIEKRAQDESDRIVITHEYTAKDAPSYPNKEGL